MNHLEQKSIDSASESAPYAYPQHLVQALLNADRKKLLALVQDDYVMSPHFHALDRRQESDVQDPC